MKKETQKHVLIALVLFLIVGAFRVNHKNRLVVERSVIRFVMGTEAKMMAAVRNEAEARELFRGAFAEMERLEAMMSDRDPNSELSRLSERAWKEPVRVSPELFEVLRAAVRYSELSGGAFDVTVGPEVKLWRRMQKTGEPPSEEELAQARARVGWEKLILDPENQTVRFAVEGMELDVGAIAKGYAVDHAAQLLIDGGAKAGMVDLGGNIRCFGAVPQYPRGWNIGLQDPRREGLLTTLVLNDVSVATSGDYRRFVEVEGERQSHILKPGSGRSVGDLISVTIIASTAMEADALSTAVSVMGEEKGLELIESLEGVEAILVTAAKPERLVTTSGAKAYILDTD